MGVQDKDVSAMEWDSEAVRRKLHRKLPGQIVDGSFLGLAWLGKCTPLASNRLYGVEKIKNISVEGISGSDSVKVTLNGDGEMINIYISPETLKEDKSIIEDLIAAAHNNAKEKLKLKTSEEISKATGGFGIPGFKWPL